MLELVEHCHELPALHGSKPKNVNYKMRSLILVTTAQRDGPDHESIAPEVSMQLSTAASLNALEFEVKIKISPINCTEPAATH